MDFLECGICHTPYNEDDHRPHSSRCGHEFCSTCLKALINSGEYVCPKCREKIKVNVVEDLPVAFGLIDVIRAFRANTISLTKEADLRVTGASNEDVCSIHCNSISHWCIKCLLYICVDCLDSHTSLVGCSTTSSTKAIEDLKENSNKTVEQLLIKFEKDTSHISSTIQDHIDKRDELLKTAEKHDEEAKKLRNVLKEGGQYKEKLVESKKYLNETNSPNAIHDRIKIVTQRKQVLLTWSAKNLGMEIPLDSKENLLKSLREESIHVEKIIKSEKRHSKLSQYDGNIYLHTFHREKITNKSSCISFDSLQKMIPSDASLVFLELCQADGVKERILLRLNKDIPNIRKYMLQMFTGECGWSLNGITLNYTADYLHKDNIGFSETSITPDEYQKAKAYVGDIYACFSSGYLQHIYFNLKNSPFTIYDGWYVIGSIENGLEFLQKYMNTRKYAKIIDCGLLI